MSSLWPGRLVVKNDESGICYHDLDGTRLKRFQELELLPPTRKWLRISYDWDQPADDTSDPKRPSPRRSLARRRLGGHHRSARAPQHPPGRLLPTGRRDPPRCQEPQATRADPGTHAAFRLESAPPPTPPKPRRHPLRPLPLWRWVLHRQTGPRDVM